MVGEKESMGESGAFVISLRESQMMGCTVLCRGQCAARAAFGSCFLLPIAAPMGRTETAEPLLLASAACSSWHTDPECCPTSLSEDCFNFTLPFVRNPPGC